jgi:hypothetical protein
MHTEEPDARGSTTRASHPTQDHPRVATAHRTTGGAIATATRSERFLAAGTHTEYRRATFAALTVLYALLAALLGVLVDVLESPPAVVTAIIVATFFGALMANDIDLRGRRAR